MLIADMRLHDAAPQMQACANKDCEIVDGNKKMPAMNKFQALKAVSVLAGWC